MAKYDGYQPRLEAMVTELQTEWADDTADVPVDRRKAIASRLHTDPAAASTIRYDRMHTGFARVIVVTAADLAAGDHPA